MVADAWDRNSYLNLWVCDLGSGLLGYAQFPGGAAATDGVVCDYQAFGNTGAAAAPFSTWAVLPPRSRSLAEPSPHLGRWWFTVMDDFCQILHLQMVPTMAVIWAPFHVVPKIWYRTTWIILTTTV